MRLLLAKPDSLGFISRPHREVDNSRRGSRQLTPVNYLSLLHSMGIYTHSSSIFKWLKFSKAMKITQLLGMYEIIFKFKFIIIIVIVIIEFQGVLLSIKTIMVSL